MVPRKVRELKADLRRAGCTERPGKGSHTVWQHPLVTAKFVLSGGDGDDAKPYQDRKLHVFLDALRRAREEQPR